LKTRDTDTLLVGVVRGHPKSSDFALTDEQVQTKSDDDSIPWVLRCIEQRGEFIHRDELLVLRGFGANSNPYIGIEVQRGVAPLPTEFKERSKYRYVRIPVARATPTLRIEEPDQDS
jgi:hypothetical protein